MRPSQSAAALIIGGTGSRPSSRGGAHERPASAGRTGSKTTLRSPRRAFSWTQLSRLTKLEFRNAGGNYGLHYDGQIVVSVQDQARSLGVKPGWKIEMVDNQVVNSSDEVWARLQEAKWQWRSCYVWFTTDMKQIKAEQAAKKVREVKAEAERLAKLPFADAQDPKHLEQIKEFIPFQGYIDHREDRAISLPQLKMVMKWTKDHCHRWRDADPPELSKTSRMHLTMDFMNTYHLNHWLIKPATLEKDCSFVEMLTAQKQPADWFVIHWWGDRLKDVLKCLELQIQTRGLSENTAFWFGAFACRAHSMQDDVGINPEATCYFRAMRQAKFKVFLILDSKTEHSGPATPFKRAWCGYEMSMTLASAGESTTVMDVATCEGTKPTIITQGLTVAEEAMEVAEPGSGYKAKAEREKGFSLEIVNLALAVQVQSGQTLRAKDKQRILNSIAQRDLTLPPDLKHESYTKYNSRLRAMLALGFWRRVMTGTGEHSETQALQAKMAAALKGDEWREKMEISMAYLSGADVEDKITLAAKNLPVHLKHLHIDLKGVDISNELLTVISLALPRSLVSLTLDLSRNEKVDNLGVETMVTKLPPGLASLKLELEQTSTTKELTEKRNSLEDLKQHIADEAEKGCWHSYVNLCPSPTGRMITNTLKFKQ